MEALDLRLTGAFVITCSHGGKGGVAILARQGVGLGQLVTWGFL